MYPRLPRVQLHRPRLRRADMVERLRTFVEGLEEAAFALPNDDLLRSVDNGIIQVFAP